MPVGPIPSHKLKRVQVMVMDGSQQAADLLRNMFIQLGFSNIHVASDGYSGIQIMKKNFIHMVFTDWELKVYKKKKIDGSPTASDADAMPISGPQFVKRLRRAANSPNPFIPVVMLVDKATSENIASARDAGANEVMVKPLDAGEFARRIMNLIDDTRIFVTANDYKGPCRRREAGAPPGGMTERRVREVRLVRIPD